MKALVLLVCVLVAATFAENWAWDPIPLSAIPKAQKSDSFDVFYLEAPLWKWKYGDMFEQYNMFHGALGIVNKKTNVSFTLNYDAMTGMEAAILPNVTVVGNKTEIVWLNFGGLFVYWDIYPTYWTSGKKLMTTINGDIFNEFVWGYLASVNSTHKRYYLWNVWDEPGGNEFIDAYDCVVFVWEAFEALHTLGAKLDHSQGARRNEPSLYSAKQPIPIHPNDPEMEEVRMFFRRSVEIVTDPTDLDSWLRWFRLVLKGNFYIHVEGLHYRLFLTPPFIGNTYDEIPLPGA